MEFETVFEKIKYDRMTLCEFEEWLLDNHKESFDEGYQEGVDEQ